MEATVGPALDTFTIQRLTQNIRLSTLSNDFFSRLPMKHLRTLASQVKNYGGLIPVSTLANGHPTIMKCSVVTPTSQLFIRQQALVPLYHLTGYPTIIIQRDRALQWILVVLPVWWLYTLLSKVFEQEKPTAVS